MQFREYQQHAFDAIVADCEKRCLVKMFCGSGKSLLMQRIAEHYASDVTVFVFPSLALIDQFHKTYLSGAVLLRVSSDAGATTDVRTILSFLEGKEKKSVCVTYQSFDVLLAAFAQSTARIGICCYDEAHHAVGEVYQKLIFENTVADKQVFFTATPKNANGVVMHDRNTDEVGICGRMVYDYSYLRGVEEGYLNPFELRVDLSLEDTNSSKYESISRAILTTGNQRVLTFHANVNADSDTSVRRFVDPIRFREAFRRVQLAEFPENAFDYDIAMLSIDAKTSQENRSAMLHLFKKRKRNDRDDDDRDNKIVILCSCQTIGEGVDTFSANMCVFVDPKTSYVQIIQNIGRVVRKDKDAKCVARSTVLLCCHVDKTKYMSCADREQVDEVIRQDMGKTGNFNAILNTMTALQQEDPDIYDMCIQYADSFSPQEIDANFRKQG